MMNIVATVSQPAMSKHMLDVLEYNFTDKAFDDSKWMTLSKCMNTSNTGFDILTVTNTIWYAFIQERQLTKTTTRVDVDTNQSWLEHNPSPLCIDNSRVPGCMNITIREPCNFVSNMAYFTSMTTLCSAHRNWSIPYFEIRRLIASFNNLAVGSAFLHGSGTILGGILDDIPIGHLALASYQAAITELTRDDMLIHLRNISTGKTITASEAILAFNHILLDVPYTQWTHLTVKPEETVPTQLQANVLQYHYITLTSLPTTGYRHGQ